MSENEDNTEQSDVESLTPERDAIWTKHHRRPPELCAEMVAFAGKMEQERNVWKHNAKVAADEVEAAHHSAIEWFIEFHELKLAVSDALRHFGRIECSGLQKLKEAVDKAGAEAKVPAALSPFELECNKPTNQEDK